MLSVILPTVIANLATTGCALLMVRKGPTRRLKILTFTVGLMSLAQTASFLTGIPAAYQVLAASLSVVALFVLAREIHDRVKMDRKLRLTETELPVPTVRTKAARAQSELHGASVQATTDLLLMLNAVSAEEASEAPAPSAHIEECLHCQHIAREMASAWLELHVYMENKEADPDRLHAARLKVSRAMQTQRQHELRSCHVLPLPVQELNEIANAFEMAGRS